ncbi:MAG: CDP-alcohol phosphatidyltransferase family protein [Actinomycetia bacterium]|nr:CDP-alcohol phosphatidyltransferase family protein [Actinomycetes bacterium]MCP4962678.1 CDP-alcohol phosphatidyltransferase family protein [Actinomycetes bacterium]
MPDSMGHARVADSRVLTLPNIITLARLACLPAFLWLLFSQEDRHAAAWLLGGLGATDWVDGWVARRFNQVSELGKLLDPIADRLLFLVGVTAIWVDGSVPAWIAIATLARETLVSVVALVLGALGSRRIDVTWWGKTGTFLLMFAFPLFLAGNSDVGWADAGRVLAWMCVVPGLAIHIYSAAGYVPIARLALADGRAARASSR